MNNISKTNIKRPEKRNRNKSIGSRVSDKEFATITRWAQSEGMSVSDWLLKAIKIYTVIKNDKDLLNEMLKREQLNFFTTLDFRKNEKNSTLIEIIKQI
ncbi:MAG: plasmid mobilization protein [Bacteroidota bacterium]